MPNNTLERTVNRRVACCCSCSSLTLRSSWLAAHLGR